MVTCDSNREHKIITGNGCFASDICITIYNYIPKWVQISFSMMKEKGNGFF